VWAQQQQQQQQGEEEKEKEKEKKKEKEKEKEEEEEEEEGKIDMANVLLDCLLAVCCCVVVVGKLHNSLADTHAQAKQQASKYKQKLSPEC
jgi:ABC-type Zn2+ transport system substrate-binding protein/surface adhesin